MDEDQNRDWTKEAERIASRILKPAEEEMDWDKLWELPRPTVSDDAVRGAI